MVDNILKLRNIVLVTFKCVFTVENDYAILMVEPKFDHLAFLGCRLGLIIKLQTTFASLHFPRLMYHKIALINWIAQRFAYILLVYNVKNKNMNQAFRLINKIISISAVVSENGLIKRLVKNAIEKDRKRT